MTWRFKVWWFITKRLWGNVGSSLWTWVRCTLHLTGILSVPKHE